MARKGRKRKEKRRIRNKLRRGTAERSKKSKNKWMEQGGNERRSRKGRGKM